MSSSTPVKYYCEFCGSLVRLGDRICPHCGSFFSQVRCPACQFQGESHLFRQGCPVCGFAKANFGGTPAPQAKGGKSKSPAGKKSGYEIAYVIEEEKRGKPKTGTPPWVVLLMVLAFVAVVVTAAVVAKG